MYVCVCNGVTEQDIRREIEGGCGSMTELTMRTGCGATCGCCVETARGMLDEAGVNAFRAPVGGSNVVAFPLVIRAA